MFTAGEGTAFFGKDRRQADALSEEFVGTLYAFAMGKKHEVRTLYSHGETEDGDGILWADDAETLNLVPVQVKEVRDPALSSRTLNDELAIIAAKYPRSPDLVVVASLRSDGVQPFKGLIVPDMNIRELYALIATDDRLSRWILAGDLLLERRDIYFEFDLPEIRDERSRV
jgi:hypothetical protein